MNVVELNQNNLSAVDIFNVGPGFPVVRIAPDVSVETEAVIVPAQPVGAQTDGAFRAAWGFALDSIARSRQRRHLMTLDDRLLNDIGLSRGQAEAEYRKFFWQK